LAETVDIYPTLPELAGRPAPAGPQPLDGVSLVPVLRDPAQTVRDHACHCFPRGGRMGRAIRPERHRLVEWKRRGAPPETADLELYDYASDPLETRNVAGEQPETVAGLRTILARHPEAKCGLDFGEPSMNGAAQHVVGANSPSPTHGSSVNPVRRLVRLRPRNFLFANPESISG
jgi:arylsulfatase A-like enzyme